MKNKPVTISESIIINSPAEKVFAAMTDWNRQAEWMIGTSVTGEPLAKAGSKLIAFSGIGHLGVVDTMTITAWEPSSRCDVIHTGKFVRGTGSFIVEPISRESSRFIWTESLELPFGRAGRSGWIILRPVLLFGLKVSLKRFSKWAQTYRPVTSF